MNRARLLSALCVLFLLVACGEKSEQASDTRRSGPLSQLSVDTSRITLSGLSSGGFMASQLHLAHSATFAGVGLIAAGPWWCSQGDVARALGVCTQGGDFEPAAALAYARELSENDQIDALENLENDRVWLFSGSRDETVATEVVEAAAELYRQLAKGATVTMVSDIPAVHGLPTVNQGLECSEFATPFINACSYDLAGVLLRFLHDREEAQAAGEAAGEMLEMPVPGAKGASLTDNAYVYLPPQCAAGTPCGVHVALHGCQQSVEAIGDSYVLSTGYNRWADALDLVIVYPQVASSSLMPMNPLGCWDWWGYSDRNYVARSAPQIAAIKALLDTLAGSQP